MYFNVDASEHESTSVRLLLETSSIHIHGSLQFLELYCPKSLPVVYGTISSLLSLLDVTTVRIVKSSVMCFSEFLSNKHLPLFQKAC